MLDSHMNPYNRQTLADDTIETWQSIIDLAAQILHVPSGLITRIDGNEIEIFLSSKTKDNPYPAGFKTHYPESGFYCEWVAKNIKPLLIPDARLDPMWKDNMAVGMGMVSYLGMPILRPDGIVFGTICFLDRGENRHNAVIIDLVSQFKKMIELSLKVLFANEETRKSNHLVNTLSKIFPICAYCKKVCNETKHWVPVEEYIKGISGQRASHGICPQCLEKELLTDEMFEIN
jgi:hypothetical protein